jgi:hypothetical protein
VPLDISPRVNTFREKTKVFLEKSKVIHDTSISVTRNPTAVLMHIMENIEKNDKQKKTNVESNQHKPKTSIDPGVYFERLASVVELHEGDQ